MRKAFRVEVYGNQNHAVRVKVRPYETDKRGVRLFACLRGTLETALVREYEERKEWERIAGLWC